ncbi:sentrin-specific protease 1 [Nematocida displodere]|uniref:Sentrin-specific protease 1 n=1 Tax=Nematocida displodere TaxID=1805483 RepID=A0A177EFB2_9MICR|nr:sentrin-specific protease 1 [Nematocida displodere]
MHKWVSDTVANKILQLLAENAEDAVFLENIEKKEDTKSTLLINSFYFESLKARGMASIDTWTEHADIRKIERIIFPIFQDSHWSLVVIYPKLKTCTVLDSLRPCHEAASAVLLQHSLIERVSYNCHCTQQSNTNDCGIFMLYFAGCIARKKTAKIYLPVPAERFREAIYKHAEPRRE